MFVSISALRRCLALVAATCAACLWPAPNSWGAAPSELGAEMQVNSLTFGIQQSSSVALDAGGNFVVAWQSELPGSGDEIRARRFDARGRAQGGEIAVNAVTVGHQNAPAVALDADGDFVVAWQSLVANDFEIRARRFDARGVAQGPELAVNTLRGNTNGAPAVAMSPSGELVVAWETSLHGSYEIRARRFDPHGVALGEPIAVNTVTASSQRFPAVAMDATGNFVVVWRSNVGGSFEVRAQRFSAAGEAEGGELAVNTVAAGDQLAPAVAMDERGGFVVAWENSYESRFEIRARRFSAAGEARAAEAAVSPGECDQFAPAVAMNRSGDFVLAWHQLPRQPSPDGYEMRARSFAASGKALGEELAVNTLTAGTQKTAAVALDAAGDFVVTWHGDASGSWEIAARHARQTP